MNLIDISSWQAGLDLEKLYANNPKLDGVIIKASGGVSYINPYCDDWVQWMIKNNKPWAFYHYLDDDGKHAGGYEEAKFFIQHTRNYFNHGIPIADFEGYVLRKGTAYLEEFLDTVFNDTGVKPMIYCSQSVVAENNFTSIHEKGYKLWVAQYADFKPMYDFINNPWKNGSIKPWEHETMRQYTSRMFLKGYEANLDANLFYGDINDWNRIANNAEESDNEKVIKEVKELLNKIFVLLNKII